jgi:hypothetical protein
MFIIVGNCCGICGWTAGRDDVHKEDGDTASLHGVKTRSTADNAGTRRTAEASAAKHEHLYRHEQRPANHWACYG